MATLTGKAKGDTLVEKETAYTSTATYYKATLASISKTKTTLSFSIKLAITTGSKTSIGDGSKKTRTAYVYNSSGKLLGSKLIKDASTEWKVSSTYTYTVPCSATVSAAAGTLKDCYIRILYSTKTDKDSDQYGGTDSCFWNGKKETNGGSVGNKFSISHDASTCKLTLNKGTGVDTFTGGGTKTYGTDASTKATASTGYHLVKYVGDDYEGNPGKTWTTCKGEKSYTQKWTMNANRTITCYAAPDEYTISYDKGEGTGGGPIANQTKKYGTPIYLQKNSFVKNSVSNKYCTITLYNNGTTSSKEIIKTKSYTFTNWNTDSEGNGTSYAAGAKYTANAAATLYAQWAETTSYSTVTLGVPTRAATSETGNTVTFKIDEDNTVSSRSNKKITNYTFKNWNTDENGNGTAYNGTTAYNNKTFSSNIELAAQWNTSESATSIKIPEYPKKDYYYCTEWNTATDGSGTSYAAGTSFTPSANIILYAIWKPNEIIINYYGNGADSGDDSDNNLQNNTNIYKATKTTQVTYEEKSNVDLWDVANLFSKQGYSGLNWRVGSATATTEWSQSEQTIPDSYFKTNNNSVNLYAIWTPNTYAVSFDANGGTVSSPPKTVTYNSTYGDLPAPVREGHVFAGWFTTDGTDKKNAGVQIVTKSIVKITEDTTVYARWRDADLDKAYLNSFVKAVKKRTNNFKPIIDRRITNYSVLREEVNNILNSDNIANKGEQIGIKVSKASEKGLLDLFTTFKREMTIVEESLDTVIPYNNDEANS